MEAATLNNKTNRVVFFDYLRVAATFAVILAHVSALNWDSVDVNSFEWRVFNFYDSFARWGAAVFIMISGALFLNKEISMKKIYSKNILRMLIAFIVWSIIYSFFVTGTKTQKVLAILQGHYHMWFILMIIGLYMCLPFIKPLVQNSNRMKYYLLLWFVFAFVIHEAVILVQDFGSGFITQAAIAANKSVTNMNMNIVLGYVGYFILGYYLSQITLQRKHRLIIYVLGLVGVALTAGLCLIVSLRTQTYCSNYYDRFTVNVFFEVLAVYTWFKYRKYGNERLNAFVQKLSKYSFGAYLIHALVIEQFNKLLGFNTLLFNPVFSVICISVVVFVVSFGASALLNQIPIVKKYMI